MKIAILTPGIDAKGGVSVVINMLASELKKYIKVDLISLEELGERKKEQIKNFQKINLDQYNYIIANNLRSHYLLATSNFKNGFYMFHQGSVLEKKSFWSEFKQKRKFNKIYSNKRLIFTTNCFKDEFFKKFNIKADYYIIENPFNFEKIRSLANKKIDKEYIVAVGRLTKSKNFEYLINAYKKLDLKEELWIIGDGEDRKRLEKISNKKIKFLGWQKNPYPYIKNAKLLIHPSKVESFANVLVESLILDTPIISTDIKCLADIAKDYPQVPLDDIDYFAKVIKDTLKNPPKIDKSKLNNLKVENVAKKFLDLFK